MVVVAVKNHKLVKQGIKTLDKSNFLNYVIITLQRDDLVYEIVYDKKLRSQIGTEEYRIKRFFDFNTRELAFYGLEAKWWHKPSDSLYCKYAVLKDLPVPKEIIEMGRELIFG